MQITATLPGFGIEAGCIMGMAFVGDRNVALILLCVGVGCSGMAISGKLTR